MLSPPADKPGCFHGNCIGARAEAQMCPIFQADASVMFAEISLAKASGMATPSVRVGGHKELPGEA